MKQALENYRNSVKALEENRKLVEDLEAKIELLEDETRALAAKQTRAAEELETAFRDNVKGVLSQEELDSCQAKLEKIKQDFSNSKEKVGVAKSILEETRGKEKDLKERCRVALHKFKMAAYRDALLNITDAERDKIYAAITIANHLPIGRNRCLEEMFPIEAIEKSSQRWAEFIETHNIPD